MVQSPQLYLKYLEQRRDNRALTQEDYEKLGRVVGSLTKRANQEYEKLFAEDSAYKDTVRRVMLRMISLQGGELARRQVPKSELVYPDKEENKRVQTVIQRFSDARLIVEGSNSQGKSYVEPAHDALVLGWDKLLEWKKEEEENLILQRSLTPAAVDWASQQSARFLWNANPRLDLLKQVLNSNDNWLNKVEAEFVRRSVERKSFNNRRNWGIAIAVMLGLSGLAITAWWQWQRSEKRRINAEILSQTLISENLLASNLKLEALVAGIKAGKQVKQHNQNVQADNRVKTAATLQKMLYGGIRELNQLSEHSEAVSSVAFSPDGKIIATGSWDKTVKLWNLQGQVIKTLQGHSSEVLNFAFSPDGKTIATGSKDQTAKLWDISSGKAIKTLTVNSGSVFDVAFSPDGKTIATASGNDTVKLWNLQGQVTKMLQGSTIAFSPDGKTIATNGVENTVKLWNWQGQVIKTLQGHSNFVSSVAFSPDSKTIATGSYDNTVRLWNLQGKLIKTLPGHGSKVSSVAFSPDGKTIASGSWDKTVRLWNLQGQEITTGASQFFAKRSKISQDR